MPEVTRPDDIDVLVNKEYSLPEDYIPKDLTEPDILFPFEYPDDKKLLQKEAADAIEALFEAAAKENLHLYGISGYRSYARQKAIYETNLANRGEEYTNRYSAMPGHSEHQTGLAMDVSTPSIDFHLDEGFAATPEGKWLADNAYRYGFIIRYPKDKTHITGYSYEPWHIRYVGIPLAEKLHNENLTLEEYTSLFTPTEQTVTESSLS